MKKHEFKKGDVIAVPYFRAVAKVGGIRFDEYLLDWEASEMELLLLPSHLPVAYVEENFVLVEGGDRK